jgi:uncharacterized protein
MKFPSMAVNNKFTQAFCMNFFRLMPVFLLFSLRIYGQDLPKPMVPLRLVNDYTGLLSEQQQIELNSKLQTFNDETSTQIFVVTYDSLQGFDIADFAVRLANNEDWRIGQKDKNNGILVLVSPANQRMTIQTGYGLEGAVPDAICSRLINNVLTPSFRAGEYYAGLDSATSILMSLTRGEYTADDYLKKNNASLPGIVFLLFALFLVVFIFTSRRRRFYSPGHSIPWWMMGTGGSRDGGWGNFTSGSGSFGGGSGGGGGGFGGFGGGGGGSFGGGGASGGW